MKFVHTALDMSLNKTLSIAGLSFSLVGFASADVESSISAGYSSEYIYRGLNFGDDQVSLNLGVSGTAAGLDWNVGLFHGSSNLDTGSTVGVIAAGLLGLSPQVLVAGVDETRISAGLTKGLGENIDLNVGVINTSYDIVGSLADRLEIYTGLSGSIACIDVSATAFFNTTDNWTGDTYYEVAASYSVDVVDNASATIGATYGNWNKDPFVGLLEDVDFVSLSATLNISLADNANASVGVTHVITDTPATEDETVISASLSFGL
ncbi:hypothetical protein OAG91_01730 [bacterium]|nr:hypothetical protein [bacterium]